MRNDFGSHDDGVSHAFRSEIKESVFQPMALAYASRIMRLERQHFGRRKHVKLLTIKFYSSASYFGADIIFCSTDNASFDNDD
jgi:hypothetical protein